MYINIYYIYLYFSVYFVVFVGQKQTIKKLNNKCHTETLYMSLISGFIVLIQRYRDNALVPWWWTVHWRIYYYYYCFPYLFFFYHLTGRLNYYNTLAQLSRTRKQITMSKRYSNNIVMLTVTQHIILFQRGGR